MNSNDRKGKRQMNSEELYALEKASARSAKLSRLVEEARNLDISEEEFMANIYNNTMPNDFSNNNIENTNSSMYYQNPFYQENVNTSFTNPIDTIQPEVSFADLMKPFSQNSLVNIPELSFQPEPSYQNSLLNITEPSSQPDFPFQPEFTFSSELYDIINEAQGKQIMPDLPAQHQFPSEKEHNNATKVLIPFYQVSPPTRLLDPQDDIIMTIAAFPDYGPWFTWHLRDSLAFIQNADDEDINPPPFKVKYVNTSNTNIRRYSRIKKPENLDTALIVFGEKMDISGMPKPVCTCTGTPRSCERRKGYGWTSLCCTSYLSMYPLPLYTSESQIRRIIGRRMGPHNYARVIEKMIAIGYDLNEPIDLKDYWCKHGSNNITRKH